ncbi:MAG: hypothetical protein LIQ31_14500 [Planctomycetes bacterium]|nr:hypothetical protein [Planctomycetota bacterium]
MMKKKLSNSHEKPKRKSSAGKTGTVWPGMDFAGYRLESICPGIERYRIRNKTIHDVGKSDSKPASGTTGCDA